MLFKGLHSLGSREPHFYRQRHPRGMIPVNVLRFGSSSGEGFLGGIGGAVNNSEGLSNDAKTSSKLDNDNGAP